MLLLEKTTRVEDIRLLQAVPLHKVTIKLETTITDVLPALHTLTRCDTTS